MDSLLQFIEDTNNAKSEEAIFALFEQQLLNLGFDRVLYTLATDHPSIDQKAGHGILKNYPADWMEHYAEKKYESIDPVIKQAVVTTNPFVWDQMHKVMPYTEEQKQLIRESKAAKLHCGVGLGIRSAGNELVAMGFASSYPGANLDKNAMAQLKALANQFHFAYCELKRPQHTEESSFNLNFTRKEIEVLKLSAEGKSKGVIADIMDTSSANVDYYFRNIFQKLKVNDRIVAIVVAIKYGIISP